MGVWTLVQRDNLNAPLHNLNKWNQEKTFIQKSRIMFDIRFSFITRTGMLIFSGFLLMSLNGVASLHPKPPLLELPAAKEIKEFVIHENDSTSYTLKLAYDSADMPAYFFRNVFTPVCYTDVCKPVYINLYWDLLGNYIRYDLPPHEILTKADHKEFSPEDYDQLHQILSNPNSLLKELTIYELADSSTHNLSDSVDAVSGATPKTIKNEVIAGAVYTCFTIWHIVNGQVMTEIKKITDQHCNDERLHQFLRSDNYHYQYWAIDKVIGKDDRIDTPFLPDILKVARGKNIFTARYALQKIPTGYFSPADTLQDWIWSMYKNSSYPLQIAVLEKLKTIPFSDRLAQAIARGLADSNAEQFSLMLELLTTQKNLSESVVLNLSQYLEDPNQDHATEVYHALVKLPVKDQAIRKKIKQFKKLKPEIITH